MKKIFLLLLLSLIFSSCSSDDDKKEDEKLEFIQVNITTEYNEPFDGIISLFYLGDAEATLCNDVNGVIFAKTNDSEDYLWPTSKTAGDKLTLSSDMKAVKSFYWSELSYSPKYGTPKAGKNYAIYIRANTKTSFRLLKTFKTINIDRNKKIDVILPKTNDASSFIEAKWTIENFK